MESNEEDQTKTNSNEEKDQETHEEQDKQNEKDEHDEDEHDEDHEDQKEDEHDEDHKEELESNEPQLRSDTVMVKASLPSELNVDESHVNMQQRDVEKRQIKEDMPELGDGDEETTATEVAVEETQNLPHTEEGEKLTEQVERRRTDDNLHMTKAVTIDNQGENISQPDEEGKQWKSSKQSVKSKLSVHSTYSKKFLKGSKYSYDMGPRFQDEILVARPSGDFKVAEVDSTAYEYYFMAEDEDEETVSIEDETEEEEHGIDRSLYYQKYDELQAKLLGIKVENGFLQKKLSIFFKRRKMDYVLKESHQQFDTQIRYNRTLDTLKELRDTDQEQRIVIQTELDELKVKKDAKSEELDELFKGLQAREKEIGQGLINTKTGNPIQDKLIERLIHRQKNQMEEVCQMRLKYIILRDMVTEKQDAIAALDNVGEGLHLMDYEQLKVDNRSHADKIEEKEEELTRLRAKCENTIQILAHLRDKSAALENDMEDQREDLNIIESQVKHTRENVNYLKQERDKLRTLRNELRQDSGLLAEPKLLRDMQDSIEELEHESLELDRLKEDVARKATQIRNIRRNIEHFTEVMAKRSIRMANIPQEKSKSKVFKGRPSLPTPILPEDAFNYMKNFTPKQRVRTKMVKRKMH